MLLKSNKHKAIAALLALVSVNGASLAAFDLGSASFSFPFSGGGFSSKLSDLGNYFTGGNKLSIEPPQARDMSLGKLDKNFSNSVNLNASLDLKDSALDLDSQISGESLKSTSEVIRQEVVKEVEVNKVEQELNKTLEDELKHLKNQSSSFKSGHEKVQNYESQPQSGKAPRGRTKRAAGSRSTAKIPSLSKQEKESFQKYLKVFSKLSTEKQNLLKQLKEAEKSSSNSSQTSSTPDFKKMLDALKTMNWTEEKLTLKKDLSSPPKRRAKRNAEELNKENLYGWGSWETSPWQPFFESQEQWIELMEHLEKSDKKLKDYLASRGWCGAFMIPFRAFHICIPDKDKLSKIVASNEEAISLHIASKILKSISSSSLTT